MREFVPERLEEVEAIEHPVPPFGEQQGGQQRAFSPSWLTLVR